MTIRILIVDDCPSRAASLTASLEANPKVKVTGLSASLIEALRRGSSTRSNAMIVGGSLAAMACYASFVETVRKMGIAVLPVRNFPLAADEVADLPGIEAAPSLIERIRKGDENAMVEALLVAIAQKARAREPVKEVTQKSPSASLVPILIGASTGGVEALHEVVKAFPADCPPTLIVQHIRAAFTSQFVEGLDKACAATVLQAWDGAPLQRGRIYAAPGNEMHLKLSNGSVPQCRLVSAAPRGGHRPSVDVLFESAARLAPPPVAALLTGMGRDGAEGLLAIRRRGGHTIAQDRETSVVYGMPRAAVELGAASEVLGIERIGPALLRAAAKPQPEPSVTP